MTHKVKVPRKATITIQKEYWACNIPEHRHETYDVALRCCQRYNEPARQSYQRKLAHDAERRVVCVRIWLEGETMTAAGKAVGVSCNRASQIIHKALRRSNKHKIIVEEFGKLQFFDVSPDDRPRIRRYLDLGGIV